MQLALGLRKFILVNVRSPEFFKGVNNEGLKLDS
jgi:hypothetical protein